MRSFLLLLVGALLCSGLVGQARHVTLELEAGGVVEGRVVSIDSKALVVEVDGEQKTYSTEQVRKYRFTDVDASGEPAPERSAAGVGVERTVPQDDGNREDPDAGAQAQAAANARPRYRSLWARRLDALDSAYPWLFPSEPTQWISLGIMLFALLSLAVHFSARLAATEHLHFGRATGVGLWLLLTGIGQMAMLPGSREAVAGAVAGNLIVLTIVFAIGYGLSFGASILATFLMLIQGGIGFALMQLVDATLRSIGNTTF